MARGSDSLQCRPAGRTSVNYACHPTTLAWRNRLLSPDFPGGLRELVEDATGATCLFLQGASGDLGPAAQHGADCTEADRLGRRLGYAVLGILESWPDALRTYAEVVESGAPIGTTSRVPPLDSTVLEARLDAVTFPLKPLESVAEIDRQLASCSDRAMRERLWRKRAVRRTVGDGKTTDLPLWSWRLGEALLVAQPNEAYSAFQIDLRRRMGQRPLVVLNVTNGYAGYLPPESHYLRNQYSVWQTPFAAGGLERLTNVASANLMQLLRESG